jgi:hypothetical protein
MNRANYGGSSPQAGAQNDSLSNGESKRLTRRVSAKERRRGKIAHCFENTQSENLRCAQGDSEGLCRNWTRKSLEFSRRSADLFFGFATRPRWTRKSRGPKNQVRATLPRPEFLPILGSRKAVNAQDDRSVGIFRIFFSPPSATVAPSGVTSGGLLALRDTPPGVEE